MSERARSENSIELPVETLPGIKGEYDIGEEK